MSAKTAKQYNLTQGPILNKLLLVAVPIMGTQLMQMTYNLTDMFWLGRVSSDAVAASGTAGMYLWLSMAFLMIGRMGAEIGVSQNMGRGDEDTAQAYSQNALFLAVIFGVLYGALMVFAQKPLVGFFKIQEANVAADAARYLSIAGAAVPMTYVSAVATGAFNGSGNSRIPFYVNAVGLVVNMILDPVMIIVLGWGITGAAVATAIGQTVVCVLFLLALKFSKNRPFSTYRFFVRPDGEKIRQIFKWSVPIGLESMLFTFLSMIIARFVAQFGADAIAVQRVGSQIESLSWLIGGGFASAITAFMGQNFGAKKWGRIHKGFRISTITILGWGVFVTLLLLFGGRVLFGVFLSDPEILDMGVVYLQILALCQIPTCMEAAAAGAFRGIGKTMPPSIVSIVGNTLRIPVAYLLAQTSLGLNGIWWGITLGCIFRGIAIFAWYLLLRRRLPSEDAGDDPLPA